MLIERLADVARDDRRSALAEQRAQFHATIAGLEPQLSYLAAINDALPDDAIIVEDVTQLTFVAHFAYHVGAIRQIDRAARGPTAEDERRAEMSQR